MHNLDPYTYLKALAGLYHRGRTPDVEEASSGSVPGFEVVICHASFVNSGLPTEL